MPNSSDIHAIHDQPFADLVRTAAAEHRSRWDATRNRTGSAKRSSVETCARVCDGCGLGMPESSTASMPQDFAAGALSWARAARDSGRKRLCLAASTPSTSEGEDFGSILKLVQQIRLLGLEVCADPVITGPAEARMLKEAGCAVLSHHLRIARKAIGEATGPCLSQRNMQGLRAAAEVGLQVCFNCTLGQGETSEDRLCFLQSLASSEVRPNVLHLRLSSSRPGEAEPIQPSEVIRFIATARILLPGCKLQLVVERTRLDYRSLMMAHLCGVNTMGFIPHWRPSGGLGSFADQTYLPTTREP